MEESQNKSVETTVAKRPYSKTVAPATNSAMATAAGPVATKTKPGKRYFRCVFQERSDSSQTQDVPLSVNGETLVVKRGEETILPEAFYEVAKNAVIIGKKFDPATRSIKDVKITKYLVSKIGEATEEEYLQMKKDGTEKTKKASIEAAARGTI